MYVRKFEADTIEEALKDIKRELGPDAVILKTITNKGLKGAFKKKKIEITAAISEKNYVKKAEVDTILSHSQKDEFYSGSAGYISNMIDQHHTSKERVAHAPVQSKNSYGNMGLNKQVAQTKNIANQIKSGLKEGLDEFLSLGEREEKTLRNKAPDFNFDDELDLKPTPKPMPRREEKIVAPVETPREERKMYSDEDLLKNKNKVEELEKKLFELTKNFERIHKKEPTGIYQLRTTLRSLDISEQYIQELIKKGLFELTEKDVENADIVFEFALREMMESVSIAMPMFSSVESTKSPVITVFLSEASCGQSSMVQKIGAMKNDSVIIRNVNLLKESKNNFAEKIFGLNVIKASSIAEIVTECRKAIDEGKSVFIDYKCLEIESNDTKKFIDGLRRAFKNVEVLITLSAIHTELYNRKVIGTYRRLSDGIVLSHLDACLNFGSIFNISSDIKDLPYKFFGTGEVVPDDLESATKERILAGIFKLS